MNFKVMKPFAALTFLMLSAFSMNSAYAITPGNLTLVNSAKLTYTGNATGITATASVAVNVVAAQPTLTTVADITKAENQSITTEATYTLTATNNGYDTYTFQPTTLSSGSGLTDTGNSDLTGVSYIYKVGSTTVTSISLGATALDTVSTNVNTISVPSDGVADNQVNGIQNGDTVIINSVAYVVSGAINDTGSGSVTITLNNAVPASLPIGTGVYERSTFTVQTTDVGVQTTSGTNATYNVTTTLQSTLSTPSTVTATDTFQVTIVNVTLTKYVRNVTRDNFSGTTCAAGKVNYNPGSGAVDYYLTTGAGTDCTVNARPGEDLEYLLRISTPSGGALSNAVISDVLADFTTFKTGTLKLNTQTVNDEGGTNNADGNSSGKTFPLDAATDDSGLLIQDGVPGTAGAEGSGSVSGSATVNVVYQVDVS